MKTLRSVWPTLLLAAGLGCGLMGCRSGAKETAANRPAATTVESPVLAPAPPTPAPSAPPSVVAIPPAEAPDAVAASSPGPEMHPALVSTNAPSARVAPDLPGLAAPVREVVDLAQSMVGDDVLLEYVRNSPAPFELDAEDLVHLKDLGLADTVVSAMLQRNSELREQSLTTAPAPELSEPVQATSSEPAPSPAATASATRSAASVYSETVTPTLLNETVPVEVASATVPASDNYFYSALAPYGSWLYIEPYGWCWQPTCAVTVQDWRPYAHGGRWLHTTSGWYWQSYYSWGWAPFHYGNWYLSSACGWVWVPGHVWAPAWVTWRYTPGYCGWAPLPPGCGWSAGLGLTYYGSGVSVGFGFGLSSSWYTFVGWNNCWDPYPYRRCLSRGQAAVVYNNSTVINNYYLDNSAKTVVNNGVPLEYVPSSGRREMRRLDIKDVQAGAPSPVRPEQTSLDGTKIAAYRPRVPADLKADSARRDSAPDRTRRSRASEPKASQASSGLLPTAIGPAPGRAASAPQRAPSITGRSAPARRSLSSTPGASPAASTSAATPSSPPADSGVVSAAPPSRAGSTVRSSPPPGALRPTGSPVMTSPARRDVVPPRSTVQQPTRFDRRSPAPTFPVTEPRTDLGRSSPGIELRSRPTPSRSDMVTPPSSPAPFRTFDRGRTSPAGSPSGPSSVTVPSAPAPRSVAPPPRSVVPTMSAPVTTRSASPGTPGSGLSRPAPPVSAAPAAPRIGSTPAPVRSAPVAPTPAIRSSATPTPRGGSSVEPAGRSASSTPGTPPSRSTQPR